MDTEQSRMVRSETPQSMLNPLKNKHQVSYTLLELWNRCRKNWFFGLQKVKNFLLVCPACLNAFHGILLFFCCQWCPKYLWFFKKKPEIFWAFCSWFLGFSEFSIGFYCLQCLTSKADLTLWKLLHKVSHRVWGLRGHPAILPPNIKPTCIHSIQGTTWNYWAKYDNFLQNMFHRGQKKCTFVWKTRRCTIEFQCSWAQVHQVQVQQHNSPIWTPPPIQALQAAFGGF